jgi:hypothetical protein
MFFRRAVPQDPGRRRTFFRAGIFVKNAFQSEGTLVFVKIDKNMHALHHLAAKKDVQTLIEKVV